MSGYSAFGTRLGFTTDTALLSSAYPTTWAYVGNLTAINGPSISMDTIDVSAHDSANSYREFAGGVIDGGEVSIEGNVTNMTAANVLVGLAEARQTAVFRVDFASTGDWLLAGQVTGFETQAPHDGKIAFSGSLKLTGKPVLTSTYSS